jgi:DNA-binding PadR family transcriptional regulator
MHHHYDKAHQHKGRRSAGRHPGHGGRGAGHFAAGFGGGGGGGFRLGRKLGSGDLQLVILALLAEKPRHGYEIIKEFEERSNGFYGPSPGMVYPALTYLEEIGYTTVETAGTKKLYRITDTGSTHLAANRSTVDSILEQLARIGGKMERVREAFAGEEASDEGRMTDALRAARRQLKSALVEKLGAAAEEQGRIAAILQHAADAIRGK